MDPELIKVCPDCGIGSLDTLRLAAQAAVWVMLGIAAWVDARTGKVPDKFLLLGTIFGLGALAISAGQQPHLLPIIPFVITLLSALAVGGLIWIVNELWYRWRGQDALGMGDAKWSALAALTFGYAPVLWAWALAAWLGLFWLGILRVRQRPAERLHFAPFLFIALAMIMLWPIL